MGGSPRMATSCPKCGSWVTCDQIKDAQGQEWRDIREVGPSEVGLCYAPPESLYSAPEGMLGEFRVTTRAAWTWATHWMPLPHIPTALPKPPIYGAEEEADHEASFLPPPPQAEGEGRWATDQRR